jgi:hypothetical protein
MREVVRMLAAVFASAVWSAALWGLADTEEPSHRLPVNSSNEGSKLVSMTWRAMAALVLLAAS